jgi:hypothetical protein
MAPKKVAKKAAMEEDATTPVGRVWTMAQQERLIEAYEQEELLWLIQSPEYMYRAQKPSIASHRLERTVILSEVPYCSTARLG